MGRIIQKALLLLQFLDEFGPPVEDRITDGLWPCGKGKGFLDRHCWIKPSPFNIAPVLITGPIHISANVPS